MQIHASISKLESLKPSKQVNSLFTQLVKLCSVNSSIDVKALSPEVQKMVQSLILLCGRAEASKSRIQILSQNRVVKPKKAANHVARKIVSSDAEFEKRMKLHTCDIMEVKEKLGEYDCIFLAADVRMSKEEKVKILGHIRKYMKDGGVLLVRSANGARAFLYPVVEENELMEFEVLSVFHPTNDVINSVVLVRKPIF
ncbi:hypothetical protein Pint_14164 [Pistacia integerrima]|uniref:Uncharacterized protein n=1 Tax=Pistacia integerrima TaxID=434235 RepID=A0ACC0Y5D4_9ROSI|nr:hypothetical protein Pint_14164 [Pistacia integerrima]